MQDAATNVKRLLAVPVQPLKLLQHCNELPQHHRHTPAITVFTLPSSRDAFIVSDKMGKGPDLYLV